MMTRSASYLQHLLKNPNTWVRIRKAKVKGDLGTKKQNSQERRDTFNDIVTTLKLMNIPHQLSESGKFKIMILS